MGPTIEIRDDTGCVVITWEDRTQSFDIYEPYQAEYALILDAIVIVGHEEIIIVPRNNPEVFRMWTR